MASDPESKHNWLRDFFLPPLIVGVIVVGLTFVLPRFFREAKELSYTIDEPVAYLDAQAIGDVKVEVNDVVISNLFVHTVRLWNSGDVPLKKLPISLVFKEPPTGFQVFNTSHLTTPRYEFGDIHQEALGPSQKRFVYELLNPGDQDIVKFVTNADPAVELFAHVENLTTKCIRPEAQQLGWYDWLNYGAVVIAVLASLLTSVVRLPLYMVRKRVGQVAEHPSPTPSQ